MPELVQQCESQGERDEIERRHVLDLAHAFTIGGRFGDVRRPGDVGGLLGRDEGLGAGDVLPVVELVLTSFGVDAERLVDRHSGHCREHQRGRIDLDRAPSAKAEQPEEIDRFGVELDARGIGVHRHTFGARRDFDGMAILAPEAADFVGAFGHCAAQEMENNRPVGRLGCHANGFSMLGNWAGGPIMTARFHQVRPLSSRLRQPCADG